MHTLENLFQNNQEWARRMLQEDPEFFSRLAQQQKPQYLWIGCSDSRVPANQIVDLLPGELFVHRNIANVVIHTDLNCLSVLQFAVEVLQVRHIIVCGHYGCGGVKAALEHRQYGLIDNWLRNIRDVYEKFEDRFEHLEDEQERVNRLCELNVLQQAANVCHTSIVQNAWHRGQPLSVHSWIYDVSDGRLKDLGIGAKDMDSVPDIYRLEKTG